MARTSRKNKNILKARNELRNMIKQQRMYAKYYTTMSGYARSIFKWSGLPETCSGWMIEKSAFCGTSSMYSLYFDDSLGWLTLMCSSVGEPNVYDEPVSAQLTGYNGKTWNVRIGEYVYGYGNIMRIPMSVYVEEYSYRLALLDIIIDNLSIMQNIQAVFTGTEEQQLTIQNIFQKIFALEPAFFIDESLGEINKVVQALRIAPDYNVDKMYQLKEALQSECLTMCGVYNPKTDKKERLITQEMDALNNEVDIVRAGMIEEREKFCEKARNFSEDFRNINFEVFDGGNRGDND